MVKSTWITMAMSSKCRAMRQFMRHVQCVMRYVVKLFYCVLPGVLHEELQAAAYQSRFLHKGV